MGTLDNKVKRIIDNYIMCKRNEITDELERYVYLSDIDRFHLNDEEFDYVMKSLDEKNIIVVGDIHTLYSDYDNYRYHHSRKSTNRNIQYEKLSDKRQKELLKKYKEDKDKTALEILIKAYVPLISIISSRMAKKYDIELDDIKQDAYVILLNAFQKFDFRDNTLVVFVSKYIKVSLLNYVRKYYGLYHYADSRFFNARNSVKYKYYYGEDYNEYEHNNEIIDIFLNKDKNNYKDLRMANIIYALPLDEVEDSAYTDFPFEEIVNPMIDEELKQEISQIMDDELTPNQYFDIVNYYGLEGKEAIPQQEIAKLRKCSFQNVNQSIKGAQKKLTKRFNKEMKKYYE